MKNQITLIVAFIIMLTASAVHAQIQKIKVNVPFDFETRGKTLPAGEYILKSASSQNTSWTIAGKSVKNPISSLLATTVEDADRMSQTKLTFRQYGNRYYLVEFTMPDYKINLPKSKEEKMLQRELMVNKKSDKAEIVTIAAVLN